MLDTLDKYVENKMSRIEVPEEFKPRINTVYPPNNFIEFERWFDMNYRGCNTGRLYLPIYFCGYHVNHNYGQDKVANTLLQFFVDSLPIDRQYFCISQYDDGVGVDWKGKDVLEFNMSKKGGNKYPLPLIGQPHPYKFPNEPKTYIANFIGSLTHQIREHAKVFMGATGYYISFNQHSPEEYCRIISQSYFTLCYRGYGLNSFRISEALQYGSIPVYISDEFIEIHNMPFAMFGLKVGEENLFDIEYILSQLLPYKIQDDIYKEYFTYEGTFDKIIKYLEQGH